MGQISQNITLKGWLTTLYNKEVPVLSELTGFVQKCGTLYFGNYIWISNFWKIRPTLRNGKRDNSKSPVFLAHGLTASSAQWVFGPPEKSLGYILADAGE